MDKIWYSIGLASFLCLTASCSSKTASQKPDARSTSPETVAVSRAETQQGNLETTQPSQPLTSEDFFPDPLVASASQLEPTLVPSLIPPTVSAERIPQVETGRPDPFASLGFTPAVQVKPPDASTITPIALPAPIAQVAPVPMSIAPPMIVPSPIAVSPLPSVDVSASSLPVAPPRSLAETIEISGIVQIAGKTNVIIKAPDEATSRYVTVGERLGNGKVLVKRVEMGLEPTVVLEQGGREIVRSVGSSDALVGAL